MKAMIAKGGKGRLMIQLLNTEGRPAIPRKVLYILAPISIKSI